MLTPLTPLKSNKVLWPIFLIEFLSLIVWAPIAGLAGMGYTPSFSWTNISLLIFHLYPFYILIAIPLATSFRNSGKEGLAYFSATLPPIISGLGFASLFVISYAIVGIEQISSTGDRKEAGLIFKNKCLGSGEQVFQHPPDGLVNIIIDGPTPTSIERIKNGKYEAEGPPLYHQVENNNEKQNIYGLRYQIEVNEREIDLGLQGGTLEIYKIPGGEVLARTTFFQNRKSQEFCGFAPDGYFRDDIFLRRVLGSQVHTYRVDKKVEQP